MCVADRAFRDSHEVVDRSPSPHEPHPVKRLGSEDARRGVELRPLHDREPTARRDDLAVIGHREIQEYSQMLPAIRPRGMLPLAEEARHRAVDRPPRAAAQ